MGHLGAIIRALIPPAGIARLLVVVAGGLLVLQSSPGLTPPKIAYLAAAGIAVLLSTRALWAMRERPMVEAARPWLLGSSILAALIVLSLPVALANGTPFAQWLRDAATYGLVATAPIVAVDAAASNRWRLLLVIAATTGALGALSYALYWITARNLAILPIEHLVLPTSSLPTALFVLSLAAAMLDRARRVEWIVVGGLAFGVFLLTGTRSALFFLVALPIVSVVAGRRLVRPSVGASAGIAAVAFVSVLTAQAAFVSAGRELAPPIDDGSPTPSADLSSSPGESGGPAPTAPGGPSPTPRPPPNPDATLVERLRDFLTSPERDGSIRERVTQYGVAWELFASSPLVGVGLGHPFEWTRIDGTTRRDFTADTPLVLPAKLGLLGVAWLAFFASEWVIFVRRLRRAVGPSVAGLAMTGWGGILIALAWSGTIFDDKGFSFALMLLLSLAFVEYERAGAPGPRSDVATHGDDGELVAGRANQSVDDAPAGGDQAEERRATQ